MASQPAPRTTGSSPSASTMLSWHLSQIIGRRRFLRHDPRTGPLPGIPAGACTGRFAALWLDVPPGKHRSGAHPGDPDGCADLLWDGHRLTVAGPDRVAARASLKPGAGAAVAALRFAPGVAAGFLGLPLDEITGQRVPLQAMWGRRAQAVESKLSGAAPRRTLGILQAWFAQADALPDPAMAWLFDRLAHADAPRPAALARHLGISERSLHRRCRHAIGYGPKTLARILRLQRFVAEGSAAHSTLSSAALDAGYGDQSHLAHEVKRLTGMTPTGLLARLHR